MPVYINIEEHQDQSLEDLRQRFLQQPVTIHEPGRVNERDVVCDNRDPRCARHPGNLYFAVVLAQLLSASPRTMVELRNDPSLRQLVAEEVIAGIHEVGGRFLGRTVRETYKELGTGLAIRWVSHVISNTAAQAIA